MAGSEHWKIWWLWGIPVAWSASALLLAAEELRLSGLPAAGDLLDVVRLAVYWFWCRLAWHASGNVGNPFRTLLAKAALSSGLVVTVLT
jgi:hypothetical protein